jgi:hypothetical protein
MVRSFPTDLLVIQYSLEHRLSDNGASLRPLTGLVDLKQRYIDGNNMGLCLHDD